MKNELIEKLKKLAIQEVWTDNWDDDACIEDFAGGNVDDAFSGGECSGETRLAREILTSLEISWS